MILGEQGEGVADRNGGPRSVGWQGGRFGENDAAQPQPFDEADGGVGLSVEDGGAALAFHDGVAEQKNVGGRAGGLQLRGLVGEHSAGRIVLLLCFEALRGGESLGMEREREDAFTLGGVGRSEGDKSDVVAAREGIGSGAQDGYVVLQIAGDDGDFEQLRRSVQAVHEDVGLAAVAKRFEDVRDGEEIALIVDEEGVAEEGVVEAAGAGSLVVGINDRAERGVEGNFGGSVRGN